MSTGARGGGVQPGECVDRYLDYLSAEKGLATLLNAHALWEQAGDPFTLLIAGQGPWAEQMQARIAELGLRRVEVLGPLDRPDLLAGAGRGGNALASFRNSSRSRR